MSHHGQAVLRILHWRVYLGPMDISKETSPEGLLGDSSMNLVVGLETITE